MTPSAVSPSVCPGCGEQFPPTLLACPGCRWLVHGAELKRLTAEAEAVSAAGDLAGALARWRGALALLPAGSRQHDQISATVSDLSRRVDAGPGRPGGVLAILVTLLSMLAFLAVYWAAYGWK